MKTLLIILNSLIFLASILSLILVKNWHNDILTPEQIKNINSKYIKFIDTTNSIESLRREYKEVIKVYESTAEHNQATYEALITFIEVLMVIAFTNLFILILIIIKNRKKRLKTMGDKDNNIY
jgi:hypothetical protein